MLSIDLEREALKQSESVSLKGNIQRRKLLPASVQPLVSIIHHQGNLDIAVDDNRKKNLN